MPPSRSSFLEYRDGSGRIASFHSLRHTFITNLARGKVHPKNAQALARHSTIDLTMNAYTHTVLGDLATDVDRLPALPPPTANGTEATALADTGTDGPHRPDDDPRRRTKWRAPNGVPCEKLSNRGGTRPNGSDGNARTPNAEKRRNAEELASFGERCPAKSDADAEAPEWRNWQTRRIQNPVGLTPREGSTPSSGSPRITRITQRRTVHVPSGAPPA